MDRKYKRVVLFGSDGCGTFFREAQTPYIDKIIKNGAATYSAITAFPSISAEGWGSMLHGVVPECHRLSNTVVGTKKYDPDSPYPSVFRVIREHDPDAVLASFVGWGSINRGIIEQNIGVTMFTAEEEDQTVAEKAAEYVRENEFDFLFVQFDTTDAAGHRHGYGSPEHYSRISDIDSYIGIVYEALSERNMLDDTLIIISTDHGGLPIRVHGGDSAEEMTIFIGVGGKNVVRGEMKNANGISVRDISAIILYALGIEIPENMDAMVPDTLFEDYHPAQTPKRKNVPVNREYNLPLFDKEKTIGDMTESGKLRSFFDFDGKVEDRNGNCTPQVFGNVRFADGIIGKAADLSEGYISLGLYKLGLDSFSFAFWLRISGEAQEESVLISNRDMSKETFPGIAFIAESEGVAFHAGNGIIETACLHPFAYPKHSRADGWRHVIIAVNHFAQGINVFYDFEKCEDQLFHSDLRECTFDSLPLCIGQDGTGKYPHPLRACIDELMIFNGAITKADVPVLKKIYENL